MQFNEAPTIFPEDRPFWDAAKKNELLLKWCSSCRKPHFYPRPHCPLCGNSETNWQKASGKGRIYSFTKTTRASGPVMAPAIIDLEEGLRVTTVIADADVNMLKIGDEVVVRFLPAKDGSPVIAFTTLQAERARQYSISALGESKNVKGVPQEGQAPLIEMAAVVGAGRMGVGITLALLAIGLPVRLVDESVEALERARKMVDDELIRLVSKGRLSAQESQLRMQKLLLSTEMSVISDADVVIEAVWEQLALKQKVFALIDAHAKVGAVLGTNTSTLDIDLIAQSTSRPGSVVGMHFFSPAHVMKLLEIVRSSRTDLSSLVTVLDLARRMGKVAVVVGICQGFVGNRLMMARESQALRLLIEGASPQQVDRVLTDFGLPMGTFELQDMAGGIEVNYRRRQESGEKNWLIDRLFELGRMGQRVAKGYYRYEPGKRSPLEDPEVTALIEQASSEEGVVRRTINDQEVIERLIYPMINEGAKLIEERIVARASDIDVVWQYGYGWPAWKGGPMYYADEVGVGLVHSRLQQMSDSHGEFFKPAKLLEAIAKSGGRLTPS